MTKTILTALALALAPAALPLAGCADAPAPAAGTESVVFEDSEASAPAADAPPAAVERAFQTEHPTATDVAWTAEAGGYEASFTEDGTAQSVVYAASGAAGAVETGIAVADLPAAVRQALDRDYLGQTVTEAARIVEGGRTTYEAEITTGGTKQDLIFQEDGTLVETVSAEAD